jgi:myosin heavy subunit
MSVPAQPGLDTFISSSTTNPTERMYSQAELAELLAKARKEEKDKLYPDIASLKEQFSQVQKTTSELQKERDEAKAEAIRIQQEKEAVLKTQQQEELSAKQLLEAKLTETNDSWEKRFNILQEERAQEKALADKERKYNELVDYRNSRLVELADDIAPQFHSFIVGDSTEQIDSAIESAKSATQSIWTEVQQATQQTTQPPRGVAPTGYTGFGPLDNASGTKTFTAEDINKMSMAEYTEFRNKQGMASRDAARSRGLFN